MKQLKTILTILFLTMTLVSALCVTVLAITESEVEAQVAASGKEAVAGNVLIWFLCAVAFLKVSQKIDSFMATLGVNVGRTGGSLLAEAMIAMRAVTMVIGGGRGAAGRAAGRAGGGSSGMAGFFRGGLIGMAERHVTNNAVRTVTTQTSAIHTVESQAAQAETAARTVIFGETAINGEPTDYSDSGVTAGAASTESVVASAGDTSVHMSRTGDTIEIDPGTPAAAGQHPGSSGTYANGPRLSTLGGMVFSRSLAAGGTFANDVIGTVARGEAAGSITGDLAAQALVSYMGYASPGIGSDVPAYSDVEIGGGRITGVETEAGSTEGRAFAMYHTEQYMAPSGEYSKAVTADGTQWYKQYAQDTVERKPYMAPDDTVAYNEKIVKKLPDPPKRKDRI